MTEALADGRVILHCGDCREVLTTMPDNSIDAVVTDPPYSLVSIAKRFGKPGSAPAQYGADGRYQRASAGFMGSSWDTGETAFDPAFWAQALRVLKPGGHVLAMGGTRTYHRLACAIEDAGFEIRDMIAWVYGSGFPKSHDVSKGIQKSRKDEDESKVRVICRFIRAGMDRLGLASSDLVDGFGNCHSRLIDHWAARDTDSQPNLPTREQWLKLKERLDLGNSVDDLFDYLDSRKNEWSDAWNQADVVREYEGQPGGFGEHRFSVRDKFQRAPTDAARQWSGWGTALKPALEPVCLARKPLGEGTVAGNVLMHGTGAINIDGCRIASSADDQEQQKRVVGFNKSYSNGEPSISLSGGADGSLHVRDRAEFDPAKGRWPANLIHDGSPEVLAAFPESAGQQGLVRGNEPSECHNDVYSGPRKRGGIEYEPRGDSGSAARFFYTSKAGAADRVGSKHPTVKPVDLIQYLIRLITPPGGTVLDPFAGTGTTGEAAIREGMRAILIEREANYCEDIRRRMRLALAGPDERARESIKARGKVEGAGPLFDDP